MATPSLESQSRRRLPQAPTVDTSVGTSDIVQRRASVDMEKKTMVSAAKKRLTPEVVAMILSSDYGSETTNANKIIEKGITTKPGSEISESLTTKYLLQGDIDFVNILKNSGQPLGFSLREHNVNKGEEPGGIFVSRLTPGGVVEQNSLLYAGDEILEINRVAVKDYKLSDVVAMIQIPKKLTLKVRFKRRDDITRTQKEHVFDDSKQSIRNVNNNYIEQEPKLDGHKSGPKQVTQMATQRSIVKPSPPGALKCRRSSSGRMLPAPPEIDPGKSQLNNRFENHLNPHTSNTVVSSNEFVRQKPGSSNTSNITPFIPNTNNSGKNRSSQIASQAPVNKDTANNLNSKHTHTSKQMTQKISTVVPMTINERTHSQAKEEGSYDGSHRLDPGDIKFDIIASNEPKFSNFDSTSNDVSRSLDKIQIEANKESVTKSSLGKTSETFGSSSSLSSSDSPKTQLRKSKNNLSSPKASRLSRSEMLVHKSHHSDGSPVSSSAENEEQIWKDLASDKVNKKPPFHHSLSSDDLNQSHNSWFSKIGHQKRKQIRKFSEGTRPFTKTAAFGEPYRLQESTASPSDEAEHGYKLYAGSPQDYPSRAVTGMLTLDIVKGAQIGSEESFTREKRKKAKVFCNVDSDGMKQASTTPKKGLNDFQWNESFEIELQRTREIRITVCLRSKKEEVKIAEGCLSLAQLLSEGDEHLLAVCLEPSGMLCIKLKFTDMKFLLQRTTSQKKEGVFGFPLETVLRRENSRIPNLVRKCVEEINKRGLETTGIYRICGNAAKKKALRAQFEVNSTSVDLGRTENPVDVNIITGLLKDFLRELPQPLLSQDVRELLSGTEAESMPDNLVSEIIKKFHRPCKATILYLFDHFVTVLMNSDANKMDSHNLAVCIGPVLLCPSLGTSTTSTVSDTKKDINAIKLLLEIWPKPEQVSAC
ncbi:rho GTPase-activating protein 100F-like [Dendronephthya gigantea]|uniref:rho GTPase-activating protein 100F-like n=1 Tax=Dendronephthya gigantea TaxID=151771 RepID=UPI00106A90D2|nr:rho GTPase-activating protein 100F-like [Dendronephthya gigantea]